MIERRLREPKLDELKDLIPKHITPELRNQFEEQIMNFWTNLTYDQEEISAYDLLNSEDIILIHRGLVVYRKQVMQRDDFTEEQLNFKKIIPKLIEIAKIQSAPIFTYLAICILSDIVSTTFEKTKLVVENGGLLLLINSLQSPYLVIANQAAQGIRYTVLANKQVQRMKVIPNLIQLIQRNQNLNTLVTSIQALGACIKYNFQLKKEVKLIISLINTFFQSIKKFAEFQKKDSQSDYYEEKQFLQYFQDGLSYIILEFWFIHQYLIDSGFITFLIHLIMNDREEISITALQILEDITDAHRKDSADYILQSKFLIQISILLKQGNNLIIEKIFKILKNLTQVSYQHLNQILRNQEFMRKLFIELKTQSTNIQKELLNFLFTATINANEDDLNFLIDQGLLESLIYNLEFNSLNDIKGNSISHNLIVLNAIFEKGITYQEQINKQSTKLQTINGFNIIKQIQSTHNKLLLIKEKNY